MYVVRAFVELRGLLSANKELATRFTRWSARSRCIALYLAGGILFLWIARVLLPRKKKAA